MKVSNYILIVSLILSIFLNHTYTSHSIEEVSYEITNVEDVIEEEEERVIEVLDGSSDTPIIEEEAPVEEKEINLFNVDGLTLKKGLTNEEVIRVKRFLIEKGYRDIVENFTLDDKTLNAVNKYKESVGLIANSIIDKEVFEKINQDIEKNNIYIPKIELIFSGLIPDSQWILINKSNNTLYHLDGSEIIKTYPVATGKTPSHTPSGQFTIVTKYINPYWGGAGIYKPVRGGAPNNPLGKRWMGLSIKGGGSYGIHGNSDSSSIGKYITLGCIRMFNDDVEYFYDIIDYGTPVWIGNEEQLKEFGVTFKFEIHMDEAINPY